jgi:hypothetical protein
LTTKNLNPGVESEAAKSQQGFVTKLVMRGLDRASIWKKFAQEDGLPGQARQ